MLEIETTSADGLIIVTPRGKIDSRTSPEFETELNDQISEGGNRMLLDFSQLEFISSAGLRVLLMVAKRIRDLGGAFVIGGPPAPVMRVMEISGFTKMLTVISDLDEARANCKA